ncbi:MAG TPA: hypothetical protein VGV69_00315 [Solirubrobacterales bacterium]|nr:hypothetical protein [Solirubrobacterales bacterium]
MSEHGLWQGVLYLQRMRAVARRFGYGGLGALAVLVATGWAMAHCRRAILLASPAIVWFGLELVRYDAAAAIVSRANLPSASSGSPSG